MYPRSGLGLTRWRTGSKNAQNSSFSFQTPIFLLRMDLTTQISDKSTRRKSAMPVLLCPAISLFPQPSAPQTRPGKPALTTAHHQPPPPDLTTSSHLSLPNLLLTSSPLFHPPCRPPIPACSASSASSSSRLPKASTPTSTTTYQNTARPRVPHRAVPHREATRSPRSVLCVLTQPARTTSAGNAIPCVRPTGSCGRSPWLWYVSFLLACRRR